MSPTAGAARARAISWGRVAYIIDNHYYRHYDFLSCRWLGMAERLVQLMNGPALCVHEFRCAEPSCLGQEAGSEVKEDFAEKRPLYTHWDDQVMIQIAPCPIGAHRCRVLVVQLDIWVGCISPIPHTTRASRLCFFLDWVAYRRVELHYQGRPAHLGGD